MKKVICLILSFCLILSCFITTNELNVLAAAIPYETSPSNFTYISTNSFDTSTSWGAVANTKDAECFVTQFLYKYKNGGDYKTSNKGFLFIIKKNSNSSGNFDGLKGNIKASIISKPGELGTVCKASENNALYRCVNAVNANSNFKTGDFYLIPYTTSDKNLFAYLFIPKDIVDFYTQNELKQHIGKLTRFPSNASNNASYDRDINLINEQYISSYNITKVSIDYPKYLYTSEGRIKILEGTNSELQLNHYWTNPSTKPTDSNFAIAYNYLELDFCLKYDTVTFINNYCFGNWVALDGQHDTNCTPNSIWSNRVANVFYNANYCKSNGSSTNQTSSYVSSIKLNVVANKNTHTDKRSYVANNDSTHNVLCGTCNAILQSNINHTYDSGKITKDSTCVATGNKDYTCILCQHVKHETIPLKEHTYGNLIAKKDATCTENGVAAHYKCSVCNNLFDSNKKQVKEADLVIKALGHNYKEVTVNATCTKEGSVKKVCSRCKDEQLVKTLPKVAHQYDNGKITKQPTETSTGIKTYTCKNCGATKTETVPKLTKKTTETTTEAKEETKQDQVSSVKINKDGLIDGKDSKEFVQDGIKYKVQINPDKTTSVYYYDTVTSSWKAVPQNNTNSTYTYTTINNNDGSKTVVIKKNSKVAKPKKVSIKSFKSTKKKAATVKFKKVKNVKGYQVKVSTSINFTKKTTKTKNIASSKAACTFNKLKSKKVYYVKIRAYKKVNGKKVYGNWSKIRKVKVR